MKTIAIALMLALGAPSASLAQVAKNDTASSPAPAKPAKAKKICRADKKTGSRLKSQTCLTAAEWAALDAANVRTTDDISRRDLGGNQRF